MLIRSYDRAVYDLISPVTSIFAPTPLEDLRSDPGQHDQDSELHRRVYAGLSPAFLETYAAFARWVACSLDGDDWVRQAVPTFRFQVPGATGTKEFHRDRDYGHPVDTVNVVVPLTTMGLTATIWVERSPQTSVFDTMTMAPGQFAIFDGANATHGTVENREGYTRVSFDFRLVPRRALPPPGTTTANRRVPLALGHYYTEV